MQRLICIMIGLYSLVYFQSCGTADQTTQTPKNKFRIIKLEMSFDELFPSYNSSSFTFIGWDKVRYAFAGGVTELVIEKSLGNITRQNFTSSTADVDLLRWAVANAGGDITKPGYSLNENIAIVAAIEDVNNIPGISSGDLGFTEQRDDPNNVPSFSYVLSTRIRNIVSSTQDRTLATNAATAHELGHARGVNLDGSAIQPPHSGTSADVANCIMQPSLCVPISTSPPAGCQNVYNPYFCEGHRVYFSSITW